MTILPSVRGRDGGERGEVDGHGHDKALGVIGVFADQVDAAGSDKDRRVGVEAGKVLSAQYSGIMHSGHILIHGQ